MRTSVASVGSLNLDVTITVERLPAPGETVLGLSTSRAGGGKGANQAAAARAAGAATAMVGRVGDDDAGRMMVEDLASRGIDVEAVTRAADEHSGTATIAVDAAHGENLIIVDPGANAGLREADVQVDAVRDAAVVLAQLEVPADAVLAAATAAAGRFVLNPSPAVPLAPALLEHVDVLVVNQSELGVLAGTATPGGPEDARAALRALDAPCSTIVTLGAAGALVHDVDAGSFIAVSAPSVTPVDTTGAGDCFCGILAARLAAGDALAEAARLAAAGAALSTLGHGARGALPALDEIRDAAAGAAATGA